MRPTPAFKWLLILLIPTTFAWKLMAERPALHETQEKIIRFLTMHNFEVTAQTLVSEYPVVRATRGDCSMIVAEASPDGSTRDMMRQFAARMDQFFVIFRGAIYSEQPVWVTVTYNWWTRFLRKLGMSQAQASPIMVAATSSCAAEQMPWAELSGGS